VRLTRRPLVFGLVAVGTVLVALGPIADGDIYWHLAAGAEMWRRRALLGTDPFTLSAAGRAWVDVHWLFQLAVALVHRLAGFVGLAVAKALVVAGGAVVATRAAERGGGPVARDTCAVALVGLLFLARHLVPIRPIVVTLLFIALHLNALEAWRSGSSARRWLWPLPFLQAVWVNCQGLAPIGPALIASYFVGESIRSRRAVRPLLLVLGLSVLASLATPYGLASVRLPAHLLARIGPSADNVFSTAIAENIPPFVLERTSPEMAGSFKWVLIGLGAALAIVRPRLHPAHALVLLGFAGLALMANRNVVLFYWIAAPLGAIAIAPRAAERLSSLRRPAWLGLRGLLGAALCAEGALAAVALAREAPVGVPTPFHFPTEAARLLAAMDARGPVFAADQHGGFLAFAVPALRPYIDTRLILHTAGEYRDYLALLDDPARFDALDAARGFQYVVLTTAYPDRALGLVAHLAESPGWRLVFTDGYEALFARQGKAVPLADRATVDGIAAALDHRFGARPEQRTAARLDLARLLIVVGQPAQAQRILEALGSRAAAQLRARGYLAGGDLAAAEGLARVLLLQDPDDTRSLTLMAEIALGRGVSAEGRRWLEEALRRDPYDAEARSVLARLDRRGL